MSAEQDHPTGKCVCGSVTATGLGDIDHAHACHCDICRKQNAGGAFHGIQYTQGAKLSGDSLTWYGTSEYGERGFFSGCGSTIAWRMKDNHNVTILSLGLFDDSTGEKIGSHIFSDLAGDYYEIGTDAPHKTAAQVIAEITAQQGG